MCVRWLACAFNESYILTDVGECTCVFARCVLGYGGVRCIMHGLARVRVCACV